MNDSFLSVRISSSNKIRLNHSSISARSVRASSSRFSVSGRQGCTCRFCKSMNNSAYSLPTSPSSPSPSSSFSSLNQLTRCTSDPVFIKHGRRRHSLVSSGCTFRDSKKQVSCSPSSLSSSALNFTFKRSSYAKTPKPGKKNTCLTPVQIAQRSSSKAVKRTIAALDEKCRHFEENQHNDSTPSQSYGSRSASMPTIGFHEAGNEKARNNTVLPPEMECSMIADWSTDTYYRVVISKGNGISILCRALEIFSDNVQIQESCCTALASIVSYKMDNPSPSTPSRKKKMVAARNDTDRDPTKLAIKLISQAQGKLPKSEAIEQAMKSILRKQLQTRNLIHPSLPEKEHSFGGSVTEANSEPSHINQVGEERPDQLSPLPASVRSLAMMPMGQQHNTSSTRRNRMSWSYPIRPTTTMDPFADHGDSLKHKTLPSDDLIMPLFMATPSPCDLAVPGMTTSKNVGSGATTATTAQLLEVLQKSFNLTETPTNDLSQHSVA